MYDENLNEGWEEIDTVDDVTHRLRYGGDVVIWMDKELDFGSEFDSSKFTKWTAIDFMNDSLNELDLSYYEQSVICPILLGIIRKFDSYFSERVFNVNVHDREYSVLELE